MSRPTFQQMEGLADFLEQNPGIAKGLLRTAQAKFTTKRKWEEVSTALNALGVAQKDGKGWAKYWADKKCALKKICGQHVQSMARTGGGPVEALPILTPIDQRLVGVMGGPKFAAGDSHVAINPFPTPNMASFLPVSMQNNDTPTVAVTPACSLDNNILVLDSAAETVDSETDSFTCLPDCSQPFFPEREQCYSNGNKDLYDSQKRKIEDSDEEDSQSLLRSTKLRHDPKISKITSTPLLDENTQALKTDTEVNKQSTNGSDLETEDDIKSRKCNLCVFEKELDKRNYYFGNLLIGELQLLPSCMRSEAYINILKYVDSLKQEHRNKINH